MIRLFVLVVLVREQVTRYLEKDTAAKSTTGTKDLLLIDIQEASD